MKLQYRTWNRRRTFPTYSQNLTTVLPSVNFYSCSTSVRVHKAMRLLFLLLLLPLLRAARLSAQPKVRAVSETEDWEQCIPVCTRPLCCKIYMMTQDEFDTECLSQFRCEVQANQDDTICACPDHSTGGSPRLRRWLEQWRRQQVAATSDTPAAPTTAAIERSTPNESPGGMFTPTATRPSDKTVIPELKQTSPPLLFLGGAAAGILMALAAALAIFAFYRFRENRRIREALLNEEDDSMSEEVL